MSPRTRAGIDIRSLVGAFVLGGVLIAAAVGLYVQSRGDVSRPASSRTPSGATVVTSVVSTPGAGGATPASSPTATATPRVVGPTITSQDWSPQSLASGDTVQIRVRYTTGDARLTQVVLEEDGYTTTGDHIRWGSIKGPNSVDFEWSEDNVLSAPFDAPANSDDSFSLSLNCLFQAPFTSKLSISFVDARGRSTPKADPIVVSCGRSTE